LLDDTLYHFDEFSSYLVPHEAAIFEGLYADTQTDYAVGIALVRKSATVPTPVSIPGSLGLFLVGLASVIYRRQLKVVR
jgi:hypothetical protein